MPVVGYICPIERSKVPFDHFDSCVAFKGRPAFSPYFGKAIADKIASDVRHSTLDMTATQIMDCPRRVYLDRTVKYHVDPRKQAASIRGTELHARMAGKLDPAIYYTEANDPVRLSIHGNLFGTPISAGADVIKRDMSEIIDAKFPKDWGVRYRDKGGKAKLEYQVQLNEMRLLLGQQEWAIAEGYDPDNVKLSIWDHSLGDMESAIVQHADHMTEQEILDVRPWGSTHTIAEHVDVLAQVQKLHAEIAPGDELASEQLAAGIPLYGASMLQGKKCVGCELREQCDKLVLKYGRPEDE